MNTAEDICACRSLAAKLKGHVDRSPSSGSDGGESLLGKLHFEGPTDVEQVMLPSPTPHRDQRPKTLRVC